MEPVMYERIFSVQSKHWWHLSRMRFLNVLLRDLPRGGLVLDAGCGPGSMLNYFSGYGEVVGVDSYPTALEMAKTHFAGQLVESDITNLPFPDEHFSLVAACEVLYHRNITDVAATVREFARVLKPGGALLLIDSAYSGCYSRHDLTAHGVRRFKKGELIAAMENAGLEIVRSTYTYALLLPLVWLLRRCKSLLDIQGKPGGELSETVRPLNNLAICWFTLEAAVAGRWGLPFGLSVQVLGKKNAHSAA